jgi:hypothetical protein
VSRYEIVERVREITAKLTNGATVSVGLTSGQVITGTVSTAPNSKGTAVITDGDGTLWTVNAGDIAAVGITS